MSSKSNVPSPDEFRKILDDIRAVPEISPEDLAAIDAAKGELESTPVAPELRELVDDSMTPTEQHTAPDMRTIIGKLHLPEKIKLALFGNAVARTLLIRDPNKLVQEVVMRNPRLTGKEIEEFAKNPNLPEHVLRLIGTSQNWTRNYSVKLSLVTNPKTPGDIALKWLRYLSGGDIKKLAKSKAVSQLVSGAAKKKLQDIEEAGR